MLGAAFAAAVPDITSNEAAEYCNSPNQPCDKLKRAASAVASALADPAPEALADAHRHVWCYRPGEPCFKAKRDALALADAVAKAHPQEAPTEDGKHTLPDSHSQAQLLKQTNMLTTILDLKDFCDSAEGPCTKVKRAAEAIAEAVAEPLADTASGHRKRHVWCHRPGEPCWKAKRGIEALDAEVKGYRKRSL